VTNAYLFADSRRDHDLLLIAACKLVVSFVWREQVWYLGDELYFLALHPSLAWGYVYHPPLYRDDCLGVAAYAWSVAARRFDFCLRSRGPVHVVLTALLRANWWEALRAVLCGDTHASLRPAFSVGHLFQ